MRGGLMYHVVFGNSIGESLKDLLHQKKALLITDEILWAKYSSYMDPCDLQVVFTSSMEAERLEVEHQKLKSFDIAIGMGGGVAMDIAKFHAWKGGKNLYQLPTAISMDAMFSYPIALRYQGRVSYVGEKIPDKIFCDFDILLKAPKIYNRSGICDLLSCHTALFDWKLSEKMGKSKIDYPLKKATESLLKEVVKRVDEISEVTESSIRFLMEGFQFVAEENFRVGHCQYEEGSEHFFYYCLEAITGKTFLHGQVINLGILLMSILQENQVENIIDVLKRAKVPIYPSSMNISYQEIEQVLFTCNDYVKEKSYPYSILNHKKVTNEYVEKALTVLKTEFDPAFTLH
ncbi:iron-containing alcohol dehydrogenase [Pleomorphovibrio marinus]|uniref:iron-containing alcohol dehydrogenase n=1 Tax=Pleomorphovibrio marinus TaxID=2164132 RepID=UPI000E0BCEEE|nr:iron-containing alcohol dehydrogenase [Pleomorphovibrio marinus]